MTLKITQRINLIQVHHTSKTMKLTVDFMLSKVFQNVNKNPKKKPRWLGGVLGDCKEAGTS
jgi:hypothetical protein